MKFQCKKCKKIKNLHKVRLSYINHNLVCKEAYCCDEYMETVDTEENAGLPTIIRNEQTHSRKSGDDLWKDARENILNGEGIDKYKKD